MDLHRSIQAAKSLRFDLAKLIVRQDDEMSSDDLAALQDTFDGETSLDVEIRRAVLAIEEDQIFIAGIKMREAELRGRRSRLEKRIEATRGLIEQAMTIAGWPKYEMDIGTVAIGKAAPRVEIDEESAIPTQFWTRQDPLLDKSGLRKTLTERHNAMAAAAKIADVELRAVALAKIDEEFPPISGAHLETEGISLIIRRA